MSRVPSEALGERGDCVARALAEDGLDALIVSDAVNVRYLSGYTGSNGLALIASAQAEPRHIFVTDFRYETQSAEEVPELFERVIATDRLLDALAPRLGAAGGRAGFEAAHLSVADHTRLRGLLAPGWELAATEAIVERRRMVKDAGELELIGAACALADEALGAVLEQGVVGRTEREVAVELEVQMRRRGAEEPSFSPIVAAGPHGALPHATPREEAIPADVLVTIDWGARAQGYCSDCTRTFATGEQLTAEAREAYELVRSAQQQALEAVRAGRSGRELDAVARAVIERAGHGEHFGHGLGHGVGLEVHEGPRLSRTAPDTPLRAGSVVSVEPGVYLPGELGVRIEDLVVVGEVGCEVLTPLPKQLIVVD